jgi:murein DD-endopeptidase MepM/ murein hydrolase activator NlpD
MRIRVLWFLALFLVACRPAVESNPTPSVAADTSEPTLIASLFPTETSTPTQTLPPTSTATSTATKTVPMIQITPKPDFQLCSPLAEQSLDELAEIVSDPYHPPPAGKDDRHHGTDFSYYRRKDRTTIAGETVQSMLPGKVVAAVNDRLPYGNMVLIETNRDDLPPTLISAFNIAPEEALYLLYAHFGHPPQAVVGQQVSCGDPLGEVGATGYNIVNPHLHLETRIGPAGADFSQGMAYYSTAASEIERSNYELWRTSGVFRHFDPMALIDWYLKSR